MILTPLVFIAALTLEILGSYVSVIGLSSKSSLILIVLAVALDFSKIVLASVLYKNWKELNILFKTFLLPATVFLMLITSYGSYAFLLQEFSKTTAVQEQLRTQLEGMQGEQSKLQQRKQEIDAQIAQVSPQFVSQKKRLNDMFAQELNYLNTRLIELDGKIPQVKSDMMKDTTQAGTLGSLAKSWGTTPDQTAKIIALMMVIVIDPLAIVMLMVGNFLQEKHRRELERQAQAKESKEFELKKLKIITRHERPVMPAEPAVAKEAVNSTPEVAAIVAMKETVQESTPVQQVSQPEEVMNPVMTELQDKPEEVPSVEIVQDIQEVVKVEPVAKEPAQDLVPEVNPAVALSTPRVSQKKVSEVQKTVTEENFIKVMPVESVTKKVGRKPKVVKEEISSPVVSKEMPAAAKPLVVETPKVKEEVSNDPFGHESFDLEDLLNGLGEDDMPVVKKKENFEIKKAENQGFDTDAILVNEKIF